MEGGNSLSDQFEPKSSIKIIGNASVSASLIGGRHSWVVRSVHYKAETIVKIYKYVSGLKTTTKTNE